MNPSRNSTSRLRAFFVAIATCLSAPSVVIAQGTVPSSFNFQSKLYTPTGQPFASPQGQATQVTFKLYSSETATNHLYEKKIPVQINGGYLEATIDDQPGWPPIHEIVKQNGTLFVGVQIGNDAELKPRMQLGSTPFASRANFSNSAGAADDVPQKAITPASITINGTQVLDSAGNVNGTTLRVNNTTLFDSLGQWVNGELNGWTLTGSNLTTTRSLYGPNFHAGLEVFVGPHRIVNDSNRLAFRSDSNIIAFDGGDFVGINTTTPTQTLDVRGSIVIADPAIPNFAYTHNFFGGGMNQFEMKSDSSWCYIDMANDLGDYDIRLIRSSDDVFEVLGGELRVANGQIVGNGRIVSWQSGGQPLLSFSNDSISTDDVRMRLVGDDSLIVEGGDFDVYGNFHVYFGTKSFVQPHPSDPSKEVVFSCLEGPENGTYCRGTSELIDGVAIVSLPEEFALVTADEGITAQVTPTSACGGLWIESKRPTQIVVRESVVTGNKVTFDWLVHGKRRGYEELQTIRENTGYRPIVGESLSEFVQRMAPVRHLLVENGLLKADGSVNIAVAERLGFEFVDAKRNRAVAEHTGVNSTKPKTE